MNRDRNKLYIILLIACFVGYTWFFVVSQFISSVEDTTVHMCLIKTATDIPCPSCGSTRSVLSISQGDFYYALLMNPMGYLIAVIMIVAPLWIGLDLLLKRQSLFDFYKKLERVLIKPIIAYPLVLLMIANWLWNIVKGL